MIVYLNVPFMQETKKLLHDVDVGVFFENGMRAYANGVYAHDIEARTFLSSNPFGDK